MSPYSLKGSKSYSPLSRPTGPPSPYPRPKGRRSHQPHRLPPFGANPNASMASTASVPSGGPGGQERDNGDLDEEPSEPATVTDVDPENYLPWKGRMIGRHLMMWRNLDDIIEEGISRDPSDNPTSFSTSRQEVYQQYLLLVEAIPLLSDIIHEFGSDGIHHFASLVNRGRGQARSEDVNSIKQNMHGWLKFDPPIDPKDRRSMGFNNPTSGRLLCPASMDWNDESVRNKLRAGSIMPQYDDFPLFLWQDEQVDLTDTFKGFLRGVMLVKAVQHIYLGPQVALHTGPGC
ncbi:hypothetical protein AX16_003216 [Volvariella volvacea WC 439]|nr:hypothetical protein AX16_003216 [Volvariella volvacea WC 439]